MTAGRPRRHDAGVRTLRFLLPALGVAMALAGVAVGWGGSRDEGDWTWSLTIALVYGPTGAFLLPRMRALGTVFAVMGASAGLALLAGEQAEAVADGRSQVLGELAVWGSSWAWVPAYVLLLGVVPHLLPDGRVLSGPLRWGWRCGVAAAVVSTTAWLLCPYDELDEASDAAVALSAINPVGIPGMGVGVGAGLVLTLVALALALPVLVVRWRRATDRGPLVGVLLALAATVLLLLASLTVPGGSPALIAASVVPIPATMVLTAAHRATQLDVALRQAQARLAIAQEEERRRLRHDLHDSLGPALAGVALQLETLPHDIDEDPERAALTAARLTDRVRSAVEEVRRLVDGLGPEGSLGLHEALTEQVQAFDAPALRSRLEADPEEVRDLPAAVEVVTARVVREALTNAARHARGDRCTVRVRREDERLEVSVRDNGVGVTAARREGSTSGSGVGIASMRAVAQQIGGSCEVADAPGGGTEVRLVLPLVLA